MGSSSDLEKHQSIGGKSRPIPQSEQQLTKRSFLTKLKVIHRTLIAGGYRSRTKAEIDAQIQEERDSWGT